jgi:hypothetical protein
MIVGDNAAHAVGLPPRNWSRANVSPRPVFATGGAAKCLGKNTRRNRSSRSRERGNPTLNLSDCAFGWRQCWHQERRKGVFPVGARKPSSDAASVMLVVGSIFLRKRAIPEPDRPQPWRSSQFVSRSLVHPSTMKYHPRRHHERRPQMIP